MTLSVEWVDLHREPAHPANPKYPDGISVDLTGGKPKYCEAQLRYPAPRCGMHIITCTTCDLRVSLSTAGRADDPRSVRIPCRSPRVVPIKTKPTPEAP